MYCFYLKGFNNKFIELYRNKYNIKPINFLKHVFRRLLLLLMDFLIKKDYL